MSRGTGGPLDPDALMREFRLYDRCVDIVSMYQWLFTETNDLPPTVAHFERYPRIAHQDGAPATPDFTVLFKDGRAIVAAIANIALVDASVESLCTQLARYASLKAVPGNASGRAIAARSVDVMFLSPMETAPDAARRIFTERIGNADHWYKPERRPYMVQFAQTPERYILQPWADTTINGALTPGATRGYESFPQLKVTPDRFADLKVRFGFSNDPVPPLYMATRLWMSVFPSMTASWRTTPIVRTADEIARLVRQQYGRAKSSEVAAGLGVLAAARLAEESNGTWTIRHQALKDDVAEAMAERVGREPSKRPTRRSRRPEPNPAQGTLFDVEN